MTAVDRRPADLPTGARRWAAVGVLCFAVWVLAIDTTILNVALPTLAAELDASTSDLQWIVEAFVLALAALLLTSGALGDRVGRRRVLVLGTSLFAVASVAAALADTAGAVIAARAVMGVGAAAIMPATLSTVRSMFPDPSERARAIGVWTAAFGLGIALGPVAGGVLLEHFAWGSVFLVNVPVAVVVVVGALLLVPETRDPVARRLDPLGTVLSAGGLALLVLGLIEAPEAGWLDPTTLATLGASAGLLAAFVAWERRAPSPMLPLGLFADRRFSVASAALALSYAAVVGVLFAVTLHLQVVLALSPLEAGVRLLPLAAGVLAFAPLTEALVRRTDVRTAVVVGLLVAGAGFAVLTQLTATSGYPPVAAALLLAGAGLGVAGTAATESILGATPVDRAGAGAAVDETAAEVGQAVGIAALGSVLASAYAGDLAVPPRVPAEAAEAARESVATAADAAAGLAPDDAALLVEAATSAFVHGMGVTGAVAVGLALAGAALAAVGLPGGRAR